MPNKVHIPPPPSALNPVSGIKPTSPLDIDNSPAESWKLFKQKWQNHAIITNLSRQSNQYQVALFLHTIGDMALKAYNGFHFETDESACTVDEVISKFDFLNW